MLKSSNEKGYRKLCVWQKADELVFQIYILTKDFPGNEIYGLVSQLRRAAVSVPANIAEGMGRQNRGETKQFINIALRSLSETEYLIDLSMRLGYLSKAHYDLIDRLRTDTGKMLWGLYQSF